MTSNAESAAPSSNRSGAAGESLIPQQPIAVDLSEGGVEAYLSRLGPIAERIVRTMEGLEDWPVDGDPRVRDGLLRLEQSLDAEALARLAQEPPPELATVLGYVRAARNLQLLELMDAATAGEQSPGDIMVALARVTRGRPEAVALLACAARFHHLERAQCLTKVYGSGRAQRILKAIGELQESPA